MVKELLVEFPYETGSRLLAKIDKELLNVTDAFWHFIPDDEEWRLVIASPLVGEKGPRYFYERIDTLLKELSTEEQESLSIVDIAVTTPYSQEVQAVRRRFGPITEETQSHFRRPYWPRSEPFIYRLAPSN